MILGFVEDSTLPHAIDTEMYLKNKEKIPKRPENYYERYYMVYSLYHSVRFYGVSNSASVKQLVCCANFACLFQR